MDIIFFTSNHLCFKRFWGCQHFAITYQTYEYTKHSVKMATLKSAEFATQQTDRGLIKMLPLIIEGKCCHLVWFTESMP